METYFIAGLFTAKSGIDNGETFSCLSVEAANYQDAISVAESLEGWFWYTAVQSLTDHEDCNGPVVPASRYDEIHSTRGANDPRRGKVRR